MYLSQDGCLPPRSRRQYGQFGRKTAQAYTTEDDDSPWALLSRARMMFVPRDERMSVLADHMLRDFDPRPTER